MASDDDSQVLDTHHEDWDWEQHKENFRVCYIDNNMTRKDAAEYMRQHFNFNATPRQWERKIKQWGFSKYTARDERLAQIAQAGKTVLDVSRPGRRPRSIVDEYGNLQPHEDRNLRRFARREVSRSRSRSRSASFVDKPRPQFKSEFSDPSMGTSASAAFNYGDMDSGMRRTLSREGSAVPSMHKREVSEPLQPTFFGTHQGDLYGSGGLGDTANSQRQWNPVQQRDLPPFAPGSTRDQFNTFPNGPIPMHGSQSINAPNSSQPFSENTTGTSFDYSMQDPSMPNFNQFSLPDTSMGMMSQGMLAEHEMYEATMQLPRGSGSNYDGLPEITFDVVDLDSSTMMAQTETNMIPAQAEIPALPANPSLNDNGPLGTDVLPLVEQYTRAVQAVTIGALSGQVYTDGLQSKIAADLVQPSKYSVMLRAGFC
jgi:hypothetical protein